MQSTFAVIAALVSVASVAAAPAGCSPSYDGTFQITAINTTVTVKRSLEKRAALILTLDNGILKDNVGRTGYIAANNQFQFDNPVQAGALITSGWSACSNGSLALGDSAVFYQCLSGRPDGTQFANLYNVKAFEATCSSALIEIMDGSSGSGVVSQQPDGQPTAASAGAPVTQMSDGQIQASSALPVTQITDGQIQAPTGNPISQISDGQIQAPTGNPISQISDGQIQAPTGAPISQISDGQIQAPTGTAAPVSQISDGQVQAPTGNPITQISDGQIQAPTSTAAPVSQISDGQVQAPTGNPISQISDGQIQASTAAPPISQISDGQIQAPTSTAGACHYPDH